MFTLLMAAAMSPIFSSPQSCKAIIWGNYGMCDTDDCKAVLYDSVSLCRTRDCRAIVYNNATQCESRDCQALLYKNTAYCTTRICRAIIYDNAGMCQANGELPLPWTRRINVVGRGATKLQADYDTRREFDNEARTWEHRCRFEGGYASKRAGFPYCRDYAGRWQCELDGSVTCRATLRR